MAIDLEKEGSGPEESASQNNSSASSSQNSGGNQGASQDKDYSNPNSHPDVRQIYVFAYECKRKNMPDYQIEQSLMNKGLDPGEVGIVMSNVNRAYHQSQQSQAQTDNGGGGGSGRAGVTFVIVGVIIIIDILSFALDWGFIIY